MHWIDWTIVAAYLTYVVWDGLRRSRGTDEIEGYFLANRSMPWWAVGLSVMATQMSAITLVGTTGQGATDGMRFVQFYFGLPLAMLILAVTLVPFFHRAKVYTAYEYLERRFDAKTRSMTSALFLLSRGMSAGVIISAPAVIMSATLGLSFPLAVALIGVPAVLYTMFGGVQAVQWVDVKQMVLIIGGLGALLVILLTGLPDDVGVGNALRLAGSTGRLETFDFSFDLNETYTFWSGVIGGPFLMLSYFGTDQSQVQRYLTARSVDEARSSLFMSAYWKIPLQALVLMVGVLVFVYYLFSAPPLLFNTEHEAQVREAAAVEYQELTTRYDQAFERRRAAAIDFADARSAGDAAMARRMVESFLEGNEQVEAVREDALTLAGATTGENPEDVNYIIPAFVLGELPIIIPGLFIAAVLAAAMSSISSELNSLSTATVIDFYRRHVRPGASDAHYLLVSKVATGFWGLFACGIAVYAVALGSLIEVVNRFGSFFYGSILGVFMLAMIPRARPIGAFVGLIAGMVSVGLVDHFTEVEFLWLNLVGAAAVVGVGMLLSWAAGPPRDTITAAEAAGIRE
ncbi:MAG: sodium:solute symporter [Gemmatimonadetes bacterium]|nr:sodium:solute symporter [Gemmatimonadota bacterium]NIQ53081.1 sodium:solute symporter [Gemmatimonadota bacterium]NIU73229.1 sodium:solute symporter [Gammaproteobacteria bacterium]NIX43496.1 sodium:solute symporter [Gemmatimonadota bacterium]NIY07675.1 sodium:solute symporter [Gemmatimonadota bacterium]